MRSRFLVLAPLFVLASWLPSDPPAIAQVVTTPNAPKWHVSRVRFFGLKRTDENWIRNDIGISFPADMGPEQVAMVNQRLRATGVFTDVQVSIVPLPNPYQEIYLSVTVTEKWTLIPVFRGAYGGGTPLTVFGIYDTHSFGRLWTLGIQTEKYGDAPRGGVVWARAPRFMGGRYSLGVEAWKDNRLRAIYDSRDKSLGNFPVFSKTLRAFLLAPLSRDHSQALSRVQVGADLRLYNYESSRFEENRDNSRQASSPYQDDEEVSGANRTIYALLRLIYDDTAFLDALNSDGYRLVMSAGPVFGQDKTQSYADLEWFVHKYLMTDLNLSWHGFVGANSFQNITHHFYLGGFESVRGLPDGVMHGTRAAYTNLELRYLFLRTRYLWLQSVAFVDNGFAGPDFADVSKDLRSSTGIGLRFAVPQVYRLTVRVDYAWSLDKPNVRGISLGMNQFIDPYKPL